MFHVKQIIHIRIDMTIPGAGSVTHIAELEEIDSSTCTMLRIIELDPSERIHGAATQSSSVGMPNKPSSTVPHPDTYADFPDIKSRPLTAEEFEGLWAEALAAFPEL
ncbi:hypothetical protein [Corynebacterium alimapuense]|uniref:Uncharacterized protein n=1 Tax=Corynebacterium alimapuense TaxID=1576874 RepID=A0A3M8K4F8_9CORY|nr:hypothetical protein [Corynebacterium alimapuense]RNE48113.1 hypothetical protein C5L39_09545 [Corynebacterium alimapuense]